MKCVKPFLLVCLGAVAAPPALAEEPDIQTPSPVIYLADNLDEADNLGWCIDTIGRGLSDRLHAHSCKPRGGDVQFAFSPETGQISSVAFEGLCADYDGTLPLGLAECTDRSTQVFYYDAEMMTFHPASDPATCLVVGATSRSAGPFMSRDLSVADCAATDPLLKTWVIRP